MAVLFTPNALAGWSNSPKLPGNEISFVKNGNSHSHPLHPKRISNRTEEFVRALKNKIFKNAEILNVKPLQDFIWLVSQQGVTPFKDVLYKRSGYVVRFFSNENWEEWADHRTPLGRVVSMYCDHLTTSQRVGVSLSRLNPKLLETANRDAAAIMNSLVAEQEPSYKRNEASSSGFFSSFLSIPLAEATPLGKTLFPSQFELSSLDGTNGFILHGEEGVNVYTGTGQSVRSAGDINGDGISDVIVGSQVNTYVVFGSNKAWTSPIQLKNLNGSNGFTLNCSSGVAGGSVSGAGDINGDGIDDIIIGVPYSGKNLAGHSFLIFGSNRSWSPVFDLMSLDGTNGFKIDGMVDNGESGYSVSKAGDINADGIDDIIIGAPAQGADIQTYPGQAYVIFGSIGPWSSPFALSSLNGINGFIINGESGMDECGYSVNKAGDINADGIDDIIIGAPYANGGKSYVIFGNKGPWTSPLQLSQLYGVNGFIIQGEGGYSGMSVSGAGDINDDGVGDILIGAPNAGTAYNPGYGKGYVIWGIKGTRPSPFALSSLYGGNGGFIFMGDSNTDACGFSVSNAGDINSDGIGDLIFGAPGAYPIGRVYGGKSYVIFGSKQPWNVYTYLFSSYLNGTTGFTINGEATQDYSGTSVSAAGDVNDDGIPDLIIGAPGGKINSAGKGYVVFGRKASQTSPTTSPITNTEKYIIIGSSIGGAGLVGLSIFGIYLLNKRCKKTHNTEGESQKLVTN